MAPSNEYLFVNNISEEHMRQTPSVMNWESISLYREMTIPFLLEFHSLLNKETLMFNESFVKLQQDLASETLLDLLGFQLKNNKETQQQLSPPPEKELESYVHVDPVEKGLRRFSPTIAPTSTPVSDVRRFNINFPGYGTYDVFVNLNTETVDSLILNTITSFDTELTQFASDFVIYNGEYILVKVLRDFSHHDQFYLLHKRQSLDRIKENCITTHKDITDLINCRYVYIDVKGERRGLDSVVGKFKIEIFQDTVKSVIRKVLDYYKPGSSDSEEAKYQLRDGETVISSLTTVDWDHTYNWNIISIILDSVMIYYSGVPSVISVDTINDTVDSVIKKVKVTNDNYSYSLRCGYGYGSKVVKDLSDINFYHSQLKLEIVDAPEVPIERVFNKKVTMLSYTWQNILTWCTIDTSKDTVESVIKKLLERCCVTPGTAGGFELRYYYSHLPFDGPWNKFLDNLFVVAKNLNEINFNDKNLLLIVKEKEK